MAKRAYILLAHGFEEVEALTPADYLRRAGAETELIAVEDLKTIGSHAVAVTADRLLDGALLRESLPDLIVIPGGLKGSRAIAASEYARKLTKKVYEAGGLVGAICAAPALALGSWGMLEGKSFTCYPNMERDFDGADKARFISERVVNSDSIITARGAGAAEEFSFALIGALFGEEAALAVKEAVVAR